MTEMNNNLCSTSVNKPYGVVVRATGGAGFTNQQGQIVITNKGTWLCAWTRASEEAAGDQVIALSRSEDNGKSWSELIELESAEKSPIPDDKKTIEGFECSHYNRIPSWVMPFKVPETGRIYVFFWFTTEPSPVRDAGHIYLKYSDDDGVSWSKRHRIKMPFHTGIDEENTPFHGWNYGEPKIMVDGRMFFTFAKIRESSILNWLSAARCISMHQGDPKEHHANVWHTMAFIMSSDNIAHEMDVEKLRFDVLPEGENGIHVIYPAKGFPVGDELSVNDLDNGRLFASFRTPMGYIGCCVSNDEGKSWSKSQAMRFDVNGPIISNPCAAEPVKRLKDGRFVLLFHNNDGSINNAWGPWDQCKVRTPMYLCVGKELKNPNNGQYIKWNQPKVIIENHIDFSKLNSASRTDVNYPQFLEWNNRYFITYCNLKHDILINEVDPKLLEC